MEQQMLLQAYLKRLKLPAVLGNYQEIARQGAQANQTYEGYLLALAELEVQHRDENAHRRRMRMARFPMIKTLDQFDFSALPSLNKPEILHLAQGEYLNKRDNLILMGNSGTGKTHLATALGLIACEQGKKVRFFTAAGLINHLVEAQAQLKLSQVQAALEKMDLVIIDEVGYVPFSESGSQLFFQVISTSYERQSLMLTTNLELSQWTQVFGSQQLTGALLDRLTHHAHIFTMNGESYRFKETMKKKKRKSRKE